MCRKPCSVMLAVAAMVTASVAAAAPITINAFGVAYTQDFNTLLQSPNGGFSSSVPTGWGFSESGTNANTTYRVGAGGSNTGDTYSFGATGNAERAFGGLQSGTLIPIIGASFTNSAGGTLTALAISYTGEQWRAGVTNRNAADRLDFQYSLDATSLSTGTWINVDALDFSSPNILATAGALDGNSAGNRAAVGSTITGLSIANGAGFWVRWTDFNISGVDDGLAVDDFSLTARGVSVPEPGSLALLGLALAGLAASRRRRQ